MTDATDTIAAVATAPGRGGVAVVRVSGPGAMSVTRAVAGAVPVPGTFRFARFRDASGAAIDEGLVLAFRAPRSFTGEDAAEFHCHGGSVPPRRVLDAALAAGARLARRGEFTQRALLNGKIRAEQAESLIDLVDARTDRAAALAFEGLSGGGAGRGADTLRPAYDALLDVSASIEHSLDVDEDDLPPDFADKTRRRIESTAASLRAELRRLNERRMMRDGSLVVIAGPPNAGKSSLLNAILGSDRAIVSPEPGTTRDAIDAWADVRGWPVRLVDTAGLRRSGDGVTVGDVEAEGVRRSERLAASADIVVWLTPPGGADSSQAAARRVEGNAPYQSAPSRAISVSSKCDLGRGPGLNVSSVTGEGVEELKDAIAARLEAAAECAAPEGCDDFGNLRAEGVREAIGVLREAADAADGDGAVLGGLVARAAGIVGDLVGATYSGDVLDRLFSRFCVGK